MTLLVLAYLGGVLTIVSPCILPVLPFVFARADRPFINSGLPMLVGMAVTFAAIATLAAVAGNWAVDANQYGRAIAMVVLAALGLTLIFPNLADRAMRPFVNFGAKLSSSVDRQDGAILPSFLLGVATGFLWAPCAGPILGLILTGAALNGANITTSLLLFAYAAGALGPAAAGQPIRFRITIDGKAPGVDHGTDADADGQGVVDSQRLYQLVRQNGVIRDRTFAIEFLDPGVHAYAFTFG